MGLKILIMAKTSKKNVKKTVIFDFTEYYNNLRDQEIKDRAEALAYLTNTDDSESNETPSNNKLTFWQKVKNLFRRKK